MTQYHEKKSSLKSVRELLGMPEAAGTTEQFETFSQWVIDLAEAHGKWWVKKYRKHIRDFWTVLESKQIQIEKTEFQPFSRTRPGLIVAVHQKADIKLENTGNDGVLDAIVSNFSAHGMYCKSTVAIQPQTKIKIRFENSSPDSSPIIFSGMVKWCHELNGESIPYSHGIGIQLEEDATDTLGTILLSDSQ